MYIHTFKIKHRKVEKHLPACRVICTQSTQPTYRPPILIQSWFYSSHFTLDLWSEFMSYGFGSMSEENGGLKQCRKNGQNFQCVKCGKWYSTKNIMLRHMNHECGVEKNIQCKFCAKMFLRKWNLKQHIKRIHENAILGNAPLSLVNYKQESPLKPRPITPGLNPM